MKKTKHLIVRLTEEQFKKITDVSIIEQRTKSSLMRELLCTCIDSSKTGINKKNQNNSCNTLYNL